MADENPEQLRIIVTEAAAFQKQGDLDKAERLRRTVFHETALLKGPEDRATLVAEGQLAFTLWCQGRYSEAEGVQKKLMELFKTLFGCDDPDTLGVTSHLVVTYHDQYKYHEAACLATDLLSRQQKIFGFSSSEALDTQQNLATTFSGQRKFEEAAEMRQSVLYGRRNATNVNCLPKLAHALVGYSQSLKDLGKANEALSLLQEALTIYESSVESDTINFLHCKAKIAQLYHIQGRTGEAIGTGRETLESRRQLLGETHPDTIVSMSDQATFLAEASRLTESQNEICCAVKLAREHLGDDNHNTISIVNNAANLYRDMGLTDTAEEMSYLSFHGARRLMGIDHPDTLSAMFLHSKILFQQGQHFAAMEGMRLCILHSKRQHGEHHFLTITREQELAAVEKNLQRLSVAHPSRQCTCK